MGSMSLQRIFDAIKGEVTSGSFKPEVTSNPVAIKEFGKHRANTQ